MTTTEPRSIPTTPATWAAFYSNLIDNNSFPETAQSDHSAGEIRKCDLVLDLSVIQATDTFAFGDVITLASNETTIDLSNGGFICVVGRIFSATATSQLTINVEKKDIEVLFYLTEIQQPLRVVFNRGSTILCSYSLPLAKEYIGLTITFRNHEITSQLCKVLDNSVQEERLLVHLIQTQLRVATLNMYTHPTLSDSIFNFICRLVPGSQIAAIADIRRQALPSPDQFQGNLACAGYSNILFVPSVKLKEYESSLSALLNTASSYSAKYNRLANKNAIISTQYHMTTAIVKMHTSASEAQNQLLAQAHTRWKDAVEALNVAQENSKATEREVQELKRKFDQGAQSWAKELRHKALVKIVATVMMCAVSIGAVLAGNVAGAVGTPYLVTHVASLLASLDTIGKDAQKVTTDVKEQLESIEATEKCLYKVLETKVISNAGTLSTTTAHAERLTVLDPDGTNAIATWDIWMNGIQGSMNTAIEKDIPFANECLFALKRQAIYGKALCLARAVAAKAGQEHALALSHSKILKSQREHLEKSAIDIGEQLETYRAKSTVVFDDLLGIKASIFGQLNVYKNLYRYHTLRDSAIVLDMSKSLPEIQLDYASERQKLVAHAESAGRPSRIALTTSLEEVSPYPQAILKRLRSESQFVITLNRTDCRLFDGLSRVRLDGLYVWLNGARPASGGSALVKLRIETSGFYEDFSHSDSLAYATQPMNQVLWYRINGVVRGKVVLGPEVSENVDVSPTPFTQWTVTLVNPKEIDLSGCISLEFEWFGTAYGT